MNWVIVALLASLVSGLNVFSLKLAGRNGSEVLNFVAVYFAVATLATATLAVIGYYAGFNQLKLSPGTMRWAVLIGIMTAANEGLFLWALYLGMPVSTGTIIYRLGSILLLMALGLFFLHEGLTIQKALGVVLAISGMILILK